MVDENLVTLSSKVQREWGGKTLLAYLSGRYPYRTAAAWQQELQAGKITLNGQPALGAEVLKFGDRTSYTHLRSEPWVNKDVKIIFEDEFLLFANKPASLPAHADGAFVQNTLIYIIRQMRPDTELFLGHRLDRETSGVNVLAKSSILLGALMPLFQKGQVEKRYIAISRGRAEKDEFTVEGGMAPDPQSEISIRWKLFPAGTPNTKPSRTDFKVLSHLKGYTVLECFPKTGRTNQIRVHLDFVGLPLAGDKLYGRSDKQFLEFLAHVKGGGDSRFAGRYECERHMLHASSLGFEHPIKQEPIKIEAELPVDMKKFIEANN